MNSLYSRKNLKACNIRKTSRTKKAVIAILVSLGLLGLYACANQGVVEDHQENNSTEYTLELNK